MQTVRKKKRSKHHLIWNSCIFSIRHHLNFETKTRFLCRDIVWSHEEIILIHFCANVFRAITMRQQRKRHYFKWTQSKFRERENFSSLVYVLKKNFTSGNFVSQTCSDGKEIPSRKEVQSDGFPLKPIAWIFWLWNQSDGYKLPFN